MSTASGQLVSSSGPSFCKTGEGGTIQILSAVQHQCIRSVQYHPLRAWSKQSKIPQVAHIMRFRVLDTSPWYPGTHNDGNTCSLSHSITKMVAKMGRFGFVLIVGRSELWLAEKTKLDVHHLSVLWASGRDPSGYEFWSPQPTTKIHRSSIRPR